MYCFYAFIIIIISGYSEDTDKPFTCEIKKGISIMFLIP